MAASEQSIADIKQPVDTVNDACTQPVTEVAICREFKTVCTSGEDGCTVDETASVNRVEACDKCACLVCCQDWFSIPSTNSTESAENLEGHKIEQSQAITREVPGDKTKDSADAGDFENAPDEIVGHTREPTQPSSGLSNDKVDVDIRRHLAAYLVRIKDRLSVDELSAVDMAYLVAYNDFETEAIYKTAREIGKKYNVYELARGDVLDIVVKVNRDGEEYEKVTFNHYRAANTIVEKLPVVMGEDGLLYYWHGQIWQPDAEAMIYNEIKKVAKNKVFNRNQHQEVITAVTNALTFKRIKLDPDPYLLGVKNGVVELATGTFRPYKKEDYITDQIDVVYDTTARCPVFFGYLETSIPRVDDRYTAIDWIVIHAIKEVFPYIMFLLGRGRNGKGLLEDLLQAFFGMKAFSGVTFEELNESKFAGIGLYRKRGQIVSEGGKERGEGKKSLPTAYVKNSTGGGMIDTDQKNKDRLQFMPYYKATIDTNDMPYIKDTTIGMQERFCKIDMPYTFVDNPKEGTNQRQKDPFLKAKMRTPQELSGILNLIIARAPEIIKTKRIYRRDSEVMAVEYAAQSNSVTTFLDEFCDYTSHEAVGVKATPIIYNDELYAKYCKWCERLNGDIVNDQRFGNALKTFSNGQKAKRGIPELDPTTGKMIRHRYQVGLSFDHAAYKSSMAATTDIKTTTTTDYDRPNTDLRPTLSVSVPTMTDIEAYSWSMLKTKSIFPSVIA